MKEKWESGDRRLGEADVIGRATTQLINPYGGRLVDVLVPGDELEELRGFAAQLPRLGISQQSVCDLELLATGAFSPLDRFMGREDHRMAVDDRRLINGALSPIPITFSIESSNEISLGQEVALTDARNEILAIMTVEEIYAWDREEVASKVFGTQDPHHPLVAEMHRWGPLNISGRPQVLQLPKHHDFRELSLTPAETRGMLEEMGYQNVVAFQTRNPLHRVHEELTKRAIEEVNGSLLLQPVVGMSKPGDVDHYTRARTYKALASKYYEPNRVLIALLALAMRMAGSGEALWHALI